GERLGQAQKSYDGAVNKLSGGSGNLVRQVEMLKAMGAATAKTIPQNLLDVAEANDAEALLQLEQQGGEEGDDAASKTIR
ncbi:MAG: hypothetical protein KDA46_00300, partial [Parvularculaceae bacterium]|nr:hypothetical protein [Parvularculaceae bacterium]